MKYLIPFSLLLTLFYIIPHQSFTKPTTPLSQTTPGDRTTLSGIVLADSPESILIRESTTSSLITIVTPDKFPLHTPITLTATQIKQNLYTTQ